MGHKELCAQLAENRHDCLTRPSNEPFKAKGGPLKGLIRPLKEPECTCARPNVRFRLLACRSGTHGTPFVLHHSVRPVDAVPWRPWPHHGNDIWSKRRYRSVGFCAPMVRPMRICKFGGCWEACWQAGELTAVSRSMLAAVKEQAKVEKTSYIANERRCI